jgi:hypothetical protein
VGLGQHLLEAGLQLNFGGLIAKYQCRDETKDHYHRSIIENQFFQEGPGFEIKLVKICDDGQI